jgi:hypothetical protein
MITLLKDFTFVGDANQDWAIDWTGISAEYQNWQLVLIVKSMVVPSSLQVTPQTTWDTDSASNVVAATTLNAVGTTIISITSGMGPMFRLFFHPTATSHLVFSAYLTPKST